MVETHIDDPEDVEPAGGDDADEVRPMKSLGRRHRALKIGLAIILVGGGIWGYSALTNSGGIVRGGAGQTTQSVYLDLEEILVNLQTGERQSRFLRARIALELPNQAAVEAVERNMPRVRDQFQVYMRELTPEDLNGAAAMFRLKEELLRRVNAAVAPVEVRDVLFQELLVQ